MYSRILLLLFVGCVCASPPSLFDVVPVAKDSGSPQNGPVMLNFNENVLKGNHPEILAPLARGKTFTLVWNPAMKGPAEHGKIVTAIDGPPKANAKSASKLGASWVGRVKGYDVGETTASFVTGADGSYFGFITYPENGATKSIKVQSLGPNTTLGFAEYYDLPKVEHPPPKLPHGWDHRNVSQSIADAPKSNSTRRFLQGAAYVHDILIGFTPAAASAMGGAQNLINTAYATWNSANQAYRDSGVPLTVNVLDVVQVSYTEAGNDGGRTLSAAQSGAIPGLANLRQQLGADLVLVVSTDNDVCGVGYLFGPGRAYAYSVVNYRCLAAQTSAHEVGHNQGCMHNYWLFSSGQDTTQPYTPGGFGWSRCDLGSSNFRTIMSYECQSGSASRVWYISNPNVMITRGGQQYPVGHATQGYCASTIQATAAAIQDYYPSTGSSGGGAGSPTYYSFKSMSSSFANCIAISGTDSLTIGLNLQHTTCDASSPRQAFYLVDTGGSWYNVKDSAGSCWNVAFGSTARGARLNMATCNNAASQKFGFFANSDDTYSVRPQSNSRLCVTVQNDVVMQENCENSRNKPNFNGQRFQTTQV